MCPVGAKLMCMFIQNNTILKFSMTCKFQPSTKFISTYSSDVVEASVVVYTAVLVCVST